MVKKDTCHVDFYLWKEDRKLVPINMYLFTESSWRLQYLLFQENVHLENWIHSHGPFNWIQAGKRNMTNLLTVLQPKEQERQTFNGLFRCDIWEYFRISMLKWDVSLWYEGMVLKIIPELRPQTPYCLPTYLTMTGTTIGGLVLQFCPRTSEISRRLWSSAQPITYFAWGTNHSVTLSS